MLKKHNQENRLIFEHFLNIAEMLGSMFTPFVEVIVHDLMYPDKSILAIYNGHITSRKVGDPTTDLGYARVDGDIPDKIFNYRNKGPNGISLKSSSLAFRNSKGELLGSLCLNMNITGLENLGILLDTILSSTANPYLDGNEDFHPKSTDGEIEEAIQQHIVDASINPLNLSRKEKKEIIKKLYITGHFNKKSSVPIIANRLNLSKPTIYKYLKHAKESFAGKND
jgi:predicted transcriptional regulator YheO